MIRDETMKRWMPAPIAAILLLGGCGSSEETPPGAVSADEARMLNEAEAMLAEMNRADDDDANGTAPEVNAAP
ncbi:hypothetical protein NX02_28260 [Sphingomonas sanxanigenens DSM 19645 = NX02]|uniref:Uncharacterized protein n=2 Tax=Sphingomonas sanxanigenens TaxID=397260 RepID=W0AH53_9SPHN|nr:hypothetical protein NX02_28260 [Sphingomonas sanxanigenens DSM 19645 = NX02]